MPGDIYNLKEVFTSFAEANDSDSFFTVIDLKVRSRVSAMLIVDALDWIDKTEKNSVKRFLNYSATRTAIDGLNRVSIYFIMSGAIYDFCEKHNKDINTSVVYFVAKCIGRYAKTFRNREVNVGGTDKKVSYEEALTLYEYLLKRPSFNRASKTVIDRMIGHEIADPFVLSSVRILEDKIVDFRELKSQALKDGDDAKHDEYEKEEEKLLKEIENLSVSV